jgi:hypothetical protein
MNLLDSQTFRQLAWTFRTVNNSRSIPTLTLIISKKLDLHGPQIWSACHTRQLQILRQGSDNKSGQNASGLLSPSFCPLHPVCDACVCVCVCVRVCTCGCVSVAVIFRDGGNQLY